MLKKSKGSLVLAMLLVLGSAPSWAANVEGRPNVADSSAISAFSDAVSGWLDSVLQAGHSMTTVIWGEYGIAIDPDGTPVIVPHSGTQETVVPAAH